MTHDGSTARSPERIAELLEIAARETRVIRHLTGCLEQLALAQAAQRELSELTATEVQDAVARRRSTSAQAISPRGVSVRGISA